MLAVTTVRLALRFPLRHHVHLQTGWLHESIHQMNRLHLSRRRDLRPIHAWHDHRPVTRRNSLAASPSGMRFSVTQVDCRSNGRTVPRNTFPCTQPRMGFGEALDHVICRARSRTGRFDQTGSSRVFPFDSPARVRAIFRSISYPETVADFLAGLCANSTPDVICRDLSNVSGDSRMDHTVRLYSQAQLPHGAPTSPAIANLAAWRMDCRLTGLERADSAQYTRYADDQALSGNASSRRQQSGSILPPALQPWRKSFW